MKRLGTCEKNNNYNKLTISIKENKKDRTQMDEKLTSAKTLTDNYPHWRGSLASLLEDGNGDGMRNRERD
jgi:hypothetical protein